MTTQGKKKGSTNEKSYSKKGGNFLGSVGELVAPSGWESFVTTAGLFALDRADSVFRRGKGKSDKEDKKSGRKMNRGGGTTSSKTSKKKYTRKQIGGDIDELSHLVYNNISPFINDETYRGIKPEWQKYIEIPPFPRNQPIDRMIINPQPTQLLKDLINTKNGFGQTLLYLACLNSNLKLYELLKSFGANPKIVNGNDSTVLHGIAWGNDDRPGGPPTYEEKLSMLKQIIKTVPELILNINQNGETFYHNLMYKHPETIPPYTKQKICSK